MFNEAFAGVLPIQGTDVAARWDLLYHFLIGVSIFFFVLVVGAMIFFVIKYRRQEGRQATYSTGSHLLEAIWVTVPTILLLTIFAWGYDVYHQMKQAPDDAYQIKVIARQWMWTFLYNNGTVSVGDLYVPLNKPVKLTMTSEDVIHSLFIPDFRIKQDVVPGMYTSEWFQATVPGRHQIFCTEYCGAGHSGMLAHVDVLTPKQWEDFIKHGKKPTNLPYIGIGSSQAKLGATSGGATKNGMKVVSLAQRGRHIYETRSCNTCHTVDGSPKIGPSWKGLYGSKVPLNNGKTVIADDNYIHESILEPQAKIVKGFGPIMPSFKGVLTEQDIAAVIAYIKTLK